MKGSIILPSYMEDELIAAVVEAAKSFDSLADANEYLRQPCQNEPRFIQLDSNVYHYRDYYINVGVRVAMAGHANVVMSIAEWNLSCAPEGIGFIWLNNDRDMVLISRIEGSENRSIIPCREVYLTTDRIPEESKRRLLADVDSMLDRNYACIVITEEPDAWYLLEGENRIIISNWQLAYVSDEAKAVYRKRVLATLGLDE